MTNKTIFAYTPPGADFPPFVNLSRQDGGPYTLTVRSQGNAGRDIGSIALFPEAVEALATEALADLFREPAAPVVTDEMVNRFLGWKLPADFSPDCGISFKRKSDYDHPEFGRTNYLPTGTNLLNALQARAMLEHVLCVTPAATAALGLASDTPPFPGFDLSADNGVRKHLTPADIEAVIVDEAINRVEGTQITLCVLTLRNGALVLGHNYGAIDPARHDWVKGAEMARADAREKVWELEGYALRERLAAASLVPALAAAAIPWTVIVDGDPATLPAPGEWLVTVDTEDGREAHVLMRNSSGKWLFGECYTADLSYFFRPIAWAPRPAAFDGEVPE